MEVTHQQPMSCFNVFSSFLQEITNTSLFGPENKENIPPGRTGKFSSEGCRGCRSGWKDIGVTQLQNISLNSCRCTPITNRQRINHTGLTPGNKYAAGSPCAGSFFPTNANVSETSLTTENDTGYLKESDCFITPVKRWKCADTVTNAIHTAATPCTQQSRLCELFQGAGPLLPPPPPLTPNTSMESTLLPRSVLLESDEDDKDGVEEQTVQKRCLFKASRSVTQPQSYLQPLQGERPPQQQGGKEECSPPTSSIPANLQPAHQQHVVQHNGPPPAYPHNEKRQTMTRVVGNATSLIAVSGRRVPIDKLHLLLRPATAEGKSGVKTKDLTTADKGVVLSAFDSSNSAPILPSSRPKPTALTSVKVISLPGAASAPPMKRPLPVYQHCDYVILEFARGVVMRFKVDPSQPLPVMGRRYLAAIKSSRSPYDNVAYEDAGVCVYLQRHHSDGNLTTGAVHKSALHDGIILREVNENIATDAERLHELRTACNIATIECCKQFRFLNLPFELVDVCYTFDRSICIVYYTIQPQEGTSSQPNISRLLRMLQFTLRTKVFLKGITGRE
ncbi:putative ESAG8-associated protein [Trypanosoma rangeli]|uniref:Putative ESAG8-associated protein n=1 Tax=Trypanosoma rangeli TaxID=5698 RepID=A0A422N794_TRYRA|nr:putative ESAG8-associated protein [Trypanosoma rangeli]RNF01357.1 putative ESAG8-associated protein [Trypanosoma rangeli]|eukprot:RNF01357.1 putative ESAG8-associated protein [Trypanosoma rangeli]